MNKSSKTNQQLLLEIEELRTRLDVSQQHLQEANERMQAEMTERKGTEQVLEERLKFETLLTELSAHFINLPADRIDSDIEDAQRRICELLDLERSALFHVSEREPGTLLLTHIHQPPGSLSPPERMNARDFFPWTVQRVLGGKTVTILKMTDLRQRQTATERVTARTAPSPTCQFRYPLEKGQYLAC
jgi:formate hydrogenlyase transcriptional activator